MKYLILLLNITSSIGFSQSEKSAKHLMDIYGPPGTIKINDSTYIDKAPITNAMYLEFEDNIRNMWNFKLHENLDILPKYNLDKAALTKFYDSIENLPLLEKIVRNNNYIISKNTASSNYLDNPKYQYNPVINITLEQAALYCLWRTDMVKIHWASKSKSKEDRGNYPSNIKYRLPTKAELQLAKKYFIDKDLLEVVKANTPDKMTLKKRGERYYLFNVTELTLDDEFRNDKSSVNASETSYKDFSTFRCICEILE